MKELFTRWSLESPEFFKRLNKFALWLIGVSGSILLLDIPEGIHVPEFIITCAKYIVFIGGAIFGTSKATVASPVALDQKLEDKGVVSAAKQVENPQ